MSSDLPAATLDSPWMKHLERAHELAHEAARAIEEVAQPSPFLAPAARRLELGVASMYDAFDARLDRVTSIAVAHARLWDTAVLVARAKLPSALAALQAACTELLAAEARFPRVELQPRAPAPLTAGLLELPLHTIERASLAPRFRAPELAVLEEPPVALPAPAAPTTFDELAAMAAAAQKSADEKLQSMLAKPAPVARTAADVLRKAPPPEEPPEGFAHTPPPAVASPDFVRGWARECIDEVGMLGIQRAPLAGDDFRELASLERRMIWSIDALASLGPVAIEHVERYAMDAPAADPIRVFAATMIAGCLEGRDALAGAERVLHRFGAGDPLVAESFVAAMKLAPNPFVASAMRTLARAADPDARALGVEVLAYRGLLTASELDALADDPDPRILALALPALAVARHPSLGRALLLAASGDANVRAAALDAMALAAHADAASSAKRAALADEPGALVRLALVADQADARWLLERARAAPSAEAMEALGWAGLVEAVPALIGWLEQDDEDVQLAAGAALDRILGAGMLDAITVLPDDLEEANVTDPDPDARPPRAPLADLVSDPRDKPPPGSPEKLMVPSIDPLKWREYWAAHGHKLDPKLRARRGQAYAPGVSLYELDRLPLAAADRRRLHRELAARTGKITRFDPHDFVAVQERSLVAWSALAAATPYVEGAWSRPVH